MSDLDLPLAVRMMQDGYLMEIQDLKAENADLRKEIALNEPLFETLNAANDALLAENAELRELVRDYEELAAALCDARECDGCPFDSEQTIYEHMRLIARVGELGVDA